MLSLDSFLAAFRSHSSHYNPSFISNLHWASRYSREGPELIRKLPTLEEGKHAMPADEETKYGDVLPSIDLEPFH